MLETIKDIVKKHLRISASVTAFDDEIKNLIKACLLDLETSGVASSVLPDLSITTSSGAEETLDPLIERAVITYSKAFFGYENSDYEKLFSSYESQKQKLCIVTDYAEPYVVEEEE